VRLVRAVARATAVEVLRQRTVLTLLVVLPLAFYVTRHDHVGQSIRATAIGLSWAVSTLAAFAAVSGRTFDLRLRGSGYTSGQLLAGRVLGLLAVSVPLTAGYTAVVLLDRDLQRPEGIVLSFAFALAVSLPLGLLVGALLPRPLEAAMVLLTLAGVQMLTDPADTWAPALPVWSVRQAITWTVDLTPDGDLVRGAWHAAAAVVLLAAAAAAVAGWALRPARHVVRRAAPDGGRT
jgi:hypothetical protein